jgi:tRNA (mo5U34)-methyltransferase
MLGAGAAEVIGIDPTPLFVLQFKALQHYLQAPDIFVLPLGIEQVPPGLKAFDTAFSMGILYHRQSPFDHLLALRDALCAGGQLILETLIVDGDENTVLTPPGRYARMGNVWCLPSVATLLGWLKKNGVSPGRAHRLYDHVYRRAAVYRLDDFSFPRPVPRSSQPRSHRRGPSGT